MRLMTGAAPLCTMLLHQTWIESKTSLVLFLQGWEEGEMEEGGLVEFSSYRLTATVNEESLLSRLEGV